MSVSELDILIWIRDNMSSAAMDAASEAADLLAGGAFTYALSLLLLIPRRTRPLGALMLFSEVLCDLIGGPLKAVTARDRPFEDYSVDLIISRPSDFSFPSGHTANAFALAFSVLCFDRRYGVAAMAFATFVAFSRLYLFVHWPTDVIAGAIMAAACVFAVRSLMKSRLEGNRRWQKFLDSDVRSAIRAKRG
jgi:undecaprenyl-diphosphatase